MRICHLIESGATGALEMVLLMVEVQRKMGHDVLLAYSRRPGAPARLRDRVHEQVRLVHLKMRPLPLFLPVWCWRYARLLRRWRPDVLHSHGSRAGFLGRLLAGRRLRGRAFHSPHCISLMHRSFSALERALYRGLERFAQRVCPAVYIACTEPERAVIAREIGAPVRLLENAIEDGLDARVEKGGARSNRVQRVVTCARIADLKDPALFASICRAVCKQRPEIEFLWIGDGDARQRRILEDAGVTVTGWMSRSDALRQVASGCVYLSTSGWEGMPVSVLEAMFLEVPVVCRRAEWSEPIVHHGQTGFLFDDSRAATEVLLTLDQAGRRKIAGNALKAARERFSEARFAAELARIYKLAH
ncbi:glycosyltransferase [Candidatus Foliamicus sp.]